MDGRAEGAQPHQVGVDHVDAELDADQVGGRVAQGAGGERVEQRAAAQPEVDQLGPAQGRGERGPGGGGARRVGAVADRAAVVQPHPAAPVRYGFHRGVGAQRDEFGGLVVRQPDLHVLDGVRQTGEAHGAHRAGPVLGGAGGQVDGEGVARGEGGAAGRAAVYEQVVDAVRAGRRAGVDALGRQGVQLDGGGAGAEGQPYAGGLGLGQGQLRVGALGAGPGGQPVRQQPARGALQFEGAADQAGGEVNGVHRVCQGSQGRAGQLRSRESRASRIRAQDSSESGALWAKPPAVSRLT